jgi:hypothetical protein
MAVHRMNRQGRLDAADSTPEHHGRIFQAADGNLSGIFLHLRGYLTALFEAGTPSEDNDDETTARWPPSPADAPIYGQRISVHTFQGAHQ